jgi:hypothetical protein
MGTRLRGTLTLPVGLVLRVPLRPLLLTPSLRKAWSFPSASSPVPFRGVRCSCPVLRSTISLLRLAAFTPSGLDLLFSEAIFSVSRWWLLAPSGLALLSELYSLPVSMSSVIFNSSVTYQMKIASSIAPTARVARKPKYSTVTITAPIPKPLLWFTVGLTGAGCTATGVGSGTSKNLYPCPSTSCHVFIACLP